MPRSSRASLVRRSVETILAGQSPSGAYVACPAFPPYRFCWLRDGSFVADAMSRAGERASATPSGELPEQAQDHLQRPERYRTWVDKWGPPPSPLLWSHAMYLDLALQDLRA